MLRQLTGVGNKVASERSGGDSRTKRVVVKTVLRLAQGDEAIMHKTFD